MSGLLNKILDWFTPSEQTQWDMAAMSLATSGWTELAIQLELGPRPKDDEPKQDSPEA